MTMSNLYTTTWRCSCNIDNSFAHKRCKTCGDVIPVTVFGQVYQEEIHQQNVEHAEEEKNIDYNSDCVWNIILCTIAI